MGRVWLERCPDYRQATEGAVTVRGLVAVASLLLLGGCASQNKEFAAQWAASNTVTIQEPDGRVITATGAEATSLLSSMKEELVLQPPSNPGENVGSEGYTSYAHSMDKYYMAAAITVLAKALNPAGPDPSAIAIAAINADSRVNQAWITGGLGLGGDVLQASVQYLNYRESERTTRQFAKALADAGNTTISVGSISQSVNGASTGEGGGTIAGGDRSITIGRDVRTFNVSDQGLVFNETGDGDVFGLQQSDATRPINNFPGADKNGNTNCDSCLDPSNSVNQSSTGSDSDNKSDIPFQPDNDQVGLF